MYVDSHLSFSIVLGFRPLFVISRCCLFFFKRTGKVWFNKINSLWVHWPLLTKELESTAKDGKDALEEAKIGDNKDKKSTCCCVSLHLLLRCSISSVCICVYSMMSLSVVFKHTCGWEVGRWQHRQGLGVEGGGRFVSSRRQKR